MMKMKSIEEKFTKISIKKKMKRLNSIRKNVFDYLINKDVASVRYESYFSFSSVNNLHPTREFLFLLCICHRELASSKRGRKKNIFMILLKPEEKKEKCCWIYNSYEGFICKRKSERKFFFSSVL